MEIGKQFLVSFGLSGFACAVGAVSFWVGRQEIADGQPDAWPRHWIAGMCVCSVALAVFWAVSRPAGFLEMLKIVLMVEVLWACAWTDWKVYLIPNKVLLWSLVIRAGIFAVEALVEPQEVFNMLASAVVPAAALLAAGLLCRLVVPKSVGFGDLKLFVVLGLYLGAAYTWNAIFYTLAASFVASVYLLVTKRASRASVIPFAPFLLIGTLAAVVLSGG